MGRLRGETELRIPALRVTGAPEVRAVHNPRTGRIERVAAGETEAMYAGMDSWMDASTVEEQMQVRAETLSDLFTL